MKMKTQALLLRTIDALWPADHVSPGLVLARVWSAVEGEKEYRVSVTRYQVRDPITRKVRQKLVELSARAPSLSKALAEVTRKLVERISEEAGPEMKRRLVQFVKAEKRSAKETAERRKASRLRFEKRVERHMKEGVSL